MLLAGPCTHQSWTDHHCAFWTKQIKLAGDLLHGQGHKPSIANLLCSSWPENRLHYIFRTSYIYMKENPTPVVSSWNVYNLMQPYGSVQGHPIFQPCIQARQLKHCQPKLSFLTIPIVQRTIYAKTSEQQPWRTERDSIPSFALLGGT